MRKERRAKRVQEKGAHVEVHVEREVKPTRCDMKRNEIELLDSS